MVHLKIDTDGSLVRNYAKRRSQEVRRVTLIVSTVNTSCLEVLGSRLHGTVVLYGHILDYTNEENSANLWSLILIHSNMGRRVVPAYAKQNGRYLKEKS